MYDPSTVAHEIRYPWGKYGKKGIGAFERTYHAPFITIWHEDPEIPGRGSRTDDSCGWFRPPTTKEERIRIEKLAREEYSNIFAKQCATRDGKDYAYVCFEPTAYDAVYWSWRRIKYAFTKGWMYGDRRRALTAGELEQIYLLSANPVDNIRVTVSGIKDADTFVDFFFIVYGAYARHHRPWYKHPRWHVHHWRFQVHPWQTFRRWALSRCCKCGGRFAWGESPTSGCWDTPPLKFLRGEKHIYHGRCGGSEPSQANSASSAAQALTRALTPSSDQSKSVH